MIIFTFLYNLNILNLSIIKTKSHELELKILKYQDLLKSSTYNVKLSNENLESQLNTKYSELCEIILNEFLKEIKKSIKFHFEKLESGIENYIKSVDLEKEKYYKIILINSLKILRKEWLEFEYEFKQNLIFYLMKCNSKINVVKITENKNYTLDFPLYYKKKFSNLEITKSNINYIFKFYKNSLICFINKYNKNITLHLKNQIFIKNIVKSKLSIDFTNDTFIMMYINLTKIFDKYECLLWNILKN